ncbi:MAG: HigA family addiction module antidote protein [Prevotellaceae bacterium]|jgi:addiction module HigA family antidote|nr:HigA family addiction module antidote protein [Prevotellaceae bacterium]
MGNLGFGYKPTHPGELLKEEIECRGISQRKIAVQMGMSYTAFNDILNERRSLSATSAMMFEAALGVKADMLMRMQTKYNLQVASQDKSFTKRLAQIRQTAAIL